MLFQHTLDKVLSGEKTQTSRLWKDSNYITSFVSPNSDAIRAIYIKPNGKFRIQYEVGQTLAIQPARGKKSVGRIEITSLAKEDIRDFTEDDIRREGFGMDSTGFYLTWLEMHNKEAYRYCLKAIDLRALQDRIETGLIPCKYALVINFKLIEVYSHDQA